MHGNQHGLATYRDAAGLVFAGTFADDDWSDGVATGLGEGCQGMTRSMFTLMASGRQKSSCHQPEASVLSSLCSQGADNGSLSEMGICPSQALRKTALRLLQLTRQPRESGRVARGQGTTAQHSRQM
eukprot:7380029-Prymnesium_polylepis.1